MQNGHSQAFNKRLFVLSAKSESCLTTYLSSFQGFLDKEEAQRDSDVMFMKDLAYTLGQRRSHHSYRVAVAANSISDLKNQLETARPKKVRDRALAFVFTGQGAQ